MIDPNRNVHVIRENENIETITALEKTPEHLPNSSYKPMVFLFQKRNTE